MLKFLSKIVKIDLGIDGCCEDCSHYIEPSLIKLIEDDVIRRRFPEHYDNDKVLRKMCRKKLINESFVGKFCSEYKRKWWKIWVKKYEKF